MEHMFNDPAFIRTNKTSPESLTTNLSLDEIKALAAALDIPGRSKINKRKLAVAIAGMSGKEVGDPETEDQDSADQASVPAAKPSRVAARHPSTNARGPDGKVIRAGKNLSGNAPFKPKFYFLDLQAADDAAELAKTAPNQVKLIMKFMAEKGIVNPEEAAQGGFIVETAKKQGFLQSNIPSENLFAYYRRVLEKLGVRESFEVA